MGSLNGTLFKNTQPPWMIRVCDLGKLWVKCVYIAKNSMRPERLYSSSRAHGMKKREETARVGNIVNIWCESSIFENELMEDPLAQMQVNYLRDPNSLHEFWKVLDFPWIVAVGPDNWCFRTLQILRQTSGRHVPSRCMLYKNGLSRECHLGNLIRYGKWNVFSALRFALS